MATERETADEPRAQPTFRDALLGRWKRPGAMPAGRPRYVALGIVGGLCAWCYVHGLLLTGFGVYDSRLGTFIAPRPHVWMVAATVLGGALAWLLPRGWIGRNRRWRYFAALTIVPLVLVWYFWPERPFRSLLGSGKPLHLAYTVWDEPFLSSTRRPDGAKGKRRQVQFAELPAAELEHLAETLRFTDSPWVFNQYWTWTGDYQVFTRSKKGVPTNFMTVLNGGAVLTQRVSEHMSTGEYLVFRSRRSDFHTERPWQREWNRIVAKHMIAQRERFSEVPLARYLWLLAGTKDRSAHREVARHADHETSTTRHLVALVLGDEETLYPDGIPALILLSLDSEEKVRETALRSLINLRIHPEAMDYLRRRDALAMPKEIRDALTRPSNRRPAAWELENKNLDPSRPVAVPPVWDVLP